MAKYYKEGKDELIKEKEEPISKQRKDKIVNYAKYIREMYWPKVSVKKQLELEHIKSTLKNQPFRNSSQTENLKDEKPWR